MRQHFTVKFVRAAVLLSAIVGAGGGPAFAAQDANNEVRVCHHQAGKIVSAPSSSGGSPSIYQCKAAVTCGAFSFPSPALCERRHRGLARRGIAVCRRAVLMMPQRQRPHPRGTDRRSMVWQSKGRLRMGVSGTLIMNLATLQGLRLRKT